MSDELSKDVVGARIKLDTSKILQSFKTIDEGARGNAESFKILNAELAITQKNYTALANAADKIALSSEERRRKILAESEALVKQRTAQAELLEAKKKQLDQTNNLVEAKLQAQQAIVKKRQAAIEQQEREHQQRMATLQQRTSLVNAQESLIQARLERQLQQLKQGNSKIETEAERHAARMKIIDNADDYLLSSANKGFLSNAAQYAQHALVFHTITQAAHEAQKALKEGLVDIESRMAGYVQTNEHYFLEYNDGTKEMVMNTEKLSAETERFIHTAHELGAEINDVTESARLWGRMYKDVDVVQELVRQSTKLSTVDLVGLIDSTEMMESVMSQYSVHLENANDAMVIGNRVLDSWSKVAHETMAPARDLGAAFERTGKIAAETGVSFDFMNGLISSGIRNTALSGENLGNMWKTVLGTIRTEKAVNEIEALGVATKEVVDGTEQWRKAEDILLDLSVKVIDKNYDLTQSYADISRGVYQFAKLAASLNAGDILLGTAASIGSTGSTMEYLKVQMDTIQRKASQTRTSLLEIFNTAGDDGLRSAIKSSLDILDQLLIGITKIPKGAMEATAAIAGLIALYKTIAPLLTQWREAQAALNSAIQMHAAMNTAATESMVVYTAAAKSAMATTAAWTAGISLVVGLLATYIFTLGSAEKAERDRIQRLKDEDAASQQMISQYERQIELLPKLVSAHNSLKESMDSGNLSNEKQIQVKKQLDQVSQALEMTLGKEGAAQLEAAKYTDEAVQIQVNALNRLIEAQRESRRNVLADQENELSKKLEENTKELEKAKTKLESLKNSVTQMMGQFFVGMFTGKDMKTSIDSISSYTDKVKDLEMENHKLESSLADVRVQAGQLAVDEIDQLAGSSGKLSEANDRLGETFENLQEQIQGNTTTISELNQLLYELSEGQSLNAENAADLILKYPQLADAIYKTADGWKFEKDAVDVLRKAKIQKAIDELEAEKNSAFNVKLATDERLKAYGIEAEAIKSLADLKAKLNGTSTQNDVTSTGEDLKYFKPQFREEGKKVMAEKEAAEKAAKDEIDAIYADYEAEMQTYDDKIKALTGLYQDKWFGVSKSSGKSGKEKSSKKDDPLQKQFEASQKFIEHQKAIGRMSTQQELLAWERVQARYKAGSEQRLQADEKVYDLRKKLADETAKKEKEAYDASMKWISHQKGIREVSAQQELEMLLRVQARYKAGSEERMQLDEQVYAAKKAAEQEFFSEFTRNLNHQKAMEQLSTEDEIKAWEKIRAMYREGTDQRMQAEEQLHSLKKKLMEEEQQTVTVSIKSIKSKMDTAKNDAIKAIETERDAFLAAQDEKIKAIDDQLKAMERLYVEEDYERQLAEKQARLALLQSAVGPEGIAERKQVQKDIEDMQREHDRDLAKQSLEDQKQALEDEKRQKEQDYNEQIDAANRHYEELSSAFDSFSETIQFKAEDLKQIQILKEGEKNAEILAQLDQFIAEYQAKMDSINSISSPTYSGDSGRGGISEEDQDLIRYNNNVDKWYSKTATPEDKAAAHAENEALRKKYGIKKDTGKLQHFKSGGVVQGIRGEAVPVVAHAGEMYINEQQQRNLFKLLNFKMPSINFTMPSFSLPAVSGGSNPQINHNYFTVSTGDTYIEDESTARVFWSEKENFVRRMQVRGGGKG